MSSSRKARYGLRAVAIVYLGALVFVPVAMVFRKAFANGVGDVIAALTTSSALHALALTLLMAAIAVPLNAVLGIACGLALARGPKWLRTPLGAVLNVPFAVPPVVVGLSLVLLYGRGGWINAPFRIIFSWPGMALATVFISLPFVAREVAPVLRELGTEPEEAAQTLGANRWQTFARITLPALGPAVAYGVVLTTARALGEYGAVSVVSGRLEGKTQTLPIFVEERFNGFDLIGAYSASVLLAVLSLLTLALMVRLRWQSTS